MTSEVFCDWLVEFYLLCRRKEKSVFLLGDNCPAHKCDSSAHKCKSIEDHLDLVTVVFLPPNTTSIIHSCNAGIIHAFKQG